MTSAEERAAIVARLCGDVLTNIVTLKMLGLFGDTMRLQLAEDETGWALLSLLPAQAFDFDRQTYPEADWVVLIDGTSQPLKLRLLEKLPPGRLVIKTADSAVKSFARERLGASKVRSFRSFTQSGLRQPDVDLTGVRESETLVPEIAALISRNGYLLSELSGHFAGGARWFALEASGKYVAAGFVYRNFDQVWEIGGVYTEPDCRRQGLARKIVAAALGHLLSRNLIPRYQVRSDNTASVQLALSVGLREFLQIDHFVVRGSSVN